MDTLKNKKSKTGMKPKRLNSSEVHEKDARAVRDDVDTILLEIIYKIVDRKFEIEMNAKIIDLGMKSLVKSISDVIDLYFFPILSIEEETDNDMWVKDEESEPAVLDSLQLDRIL